MRPLATRSIIFVLCSFTLSSAHASYAVDSTDTVMKKVLPPIHKFYIGGGTDGMIFSGANISEPSGNPKDVLRFTYGFNVGVSFNFNFSRHLGAYTGVDIKNIGFIEHNDGVTIKRRTYNIGAPVGIKIGNMAMRRTYVFFGGGIDAPFNYKEKHFQIRDQKTKFNEWFSDRTPAVMPYVFLGMAFKHGLTVKAQYYPNNYLNPDFTVNGVKPYAGYDVHLFMLSLGISMYYTKHHDMVKKDAVKMNTM